MKRKKLKTHKKNIKALIFFSSFFKIVIIRILVIIENIDINIKLTLNKIPNIIIRVEILV
jgi:hypothetical protein